MNVKNFFQNVAEDDSEKIINKAINSGIKILLEKNYVSEEEALIESKQIFQEYFSITINKFFYLKTLLNKNEPTNLYDVFIPLSLKINNEIKIIDKVEDVFEDTSSNCVIISGHGGSGKSTLMKHLFIDTIKRTDNIPIFFELRNYYNAYNENYNLEDLIFENVKKFGMDIRRDTFFSLLKEERFLIIFDGYDEVTEELMPVVANEINLFANKYKTTKCILTSRPMQNSFLEFTQFYDYEIQPLNLEQIKNFVDNIRNINRDILEAFKVDLEQSLFKTHNEFVSNPLLLGIVILTYKENEMIPTKLSEFYTETFNVLLTRHDISKDRYVRNLSSKLDKDTFKRVFSYFCFITFTNSEISFTEDILRKRLQQVIDRKKINDCFVDDLVNDFITSVSLMYKDGTEYKFIHRTFQEFFVAVFLSELEEGKLDIAIKRIMEKYSMEDYKEVFFILREMKRSYFDEKILLPILDQIEEGQGEEEDYFLKLDYLYGKESLIFRKYNDEGDISLFITVDDVETIAPFMIKGVEPKEEERVRINQKILIASLSSLYDSNDWKSEQQHLTDFRNECVKYMNENNINENNTRIRSEDSRFYNEIPLEIIKEDQKLVEMLKDCWVGKRACNLQKIILDTKESVKQRAEEFDDIF